MIIDSVRQCRIFDIDYFSFEVLPKVDIRFCRNYNCQRAVHCGVVIETCGLLYLHFEANFHRIFIIDISMVERFVCKTERDKK